MQRFVVGMACAALCAATLPAAASPGETAQRVHRAGGYPEELEFAEHRSSGFGPGEASDGSSGPSGEDGEWNEDDSDGWDHDGWGDDPQHSDPRAPNPTAGLESGTTGSDPVVPAGGVLGALGAPLSNLLLIVVLAVLVVFIAWMISRFTARRPPPTAPLDETSPPPGAPGELAQLAARDLSADPDQLVREHRIGEAIELLLLKSLLRSGWDPLRGESLTARDVVRSLATQDGRRGTLGRIVDLAERTRFGGAAPTVEIYTHMKSEFTSLVAGEPT